MQILSFTALPSEIRNHVCSFCTPFTSHARDFMGLLLASKQIRAEYESEAVDIMVKYIASLKQAWPHAEELRIDRPTKFSDLVTITVRLPVSLYYPSSETSEAERNRHFRRGSQLEPCLASLFTLHLSKLTFTCYDNQPDDWSGLADVPTGLLYDITNFLIIPSALERSQLEARRHRTLRVVQPTRVRKVCYKWYQHEHSTGWNRLDVESRHTRFFLTEPIWWEVPNAQTLVTNWGSSSRDEVFFDIDIEQRG
ncbi:hypothetical protein CC80DRAFT_542630 [Byssothecium circinans]|uniref:F-box domain-containing protein n=1 Tax=Byssothecium circinans TaxID=147558 RepID=A0A6A5UC97_9PLEO|nr:hypothetical protein CC80DRAFT_542630 [Byssothecium circinans]